MVASSLLVCHLSERLSCLIKSSIDAIVNWVILLCCGSFVNHTAAIIYRCNDCLICFVALRSKSTAMVIAGRSVHLTTLFPGQASTSGKPVIRAHTFACN